MLLLSSIFTVLSLRSLINSPSLTSAEDVCEWTDLAPNDFDFNLDGVKGAIWGINSSQWTFYYSPCKNGLICADDNVMADQINIQTTDCTAYLAKVNNSVQPVYKDRAYVFTYNNGMDG